MGKAVGRHKFPALGGRTNDNKILAESYRSFPVLQRAPINQRSVRRERLGFTVECVWPNGRFAAPAFKRESCESLRTLSDRGDEFNIVFFFVISVLRGALVRHETTKHGGGGGETKSHKRREGTREGQKKDTVSGGIAWLVGKKKKNSTDRETSRQRFYPQRTTSVCERNRR